MKKITFLLLLIISGVHSHSQNQINPFIAEKYGLDAKILALRDILSNPLDPDYNNPFLSEERYVPYLEKLSVLYENSFNNPALDSIFKNFEVHVNQEYENPIGFKKIIFTVDNASSWIDNYKNTGISDLAALDNLMREYQLSIYKYFEFPTCSCTYFIVETDFDFLNMNALIKTFEAIPDIANVEVQVADIEMRHNYTGIPYYINSESVISSNILVKGDSFEFKLYSNYESMVVQINDDEEVLSSSVNKLENISLYPNPALDKIYINGISSEQESIKIYSVQGKLIKEVENTSSGIDVSYLKTGLYFIHLVSLEGNINTLRFIKK